MTAEKQDSSGTSEAAEGAVPNLALLKAIVIGLGVLIVAGVIVLVVTIANRLGDMGEAKPADRAPPTASFGRLEIPAAPQAEILAASTSGGTILLTLRAPGRPDSVVVLDAATGQERGRLQLAPGP